MARYDRIARIDPPEREDVFSGWLTLRDLDGREREPELGRRARLRYLAIRPVRRLLRRGLDGPDPDSFERQIDAVREELGQLPAEDPERAGLERFLEEVGARSPSGLIRATLDVGAAAEAAGHSYAAEEFYRTALELSREHEKEASAVTALRQLGRVYRSREAWDDATTCLQESALIAASLDEPVEWARSMEGLAAVKLRQGDVDGARDTLDEIEGRTTGPGRGAVRAIAAVGRCALELSDGNPDGALDAGWDAITRLPAEDEARNGTLLNMGAAFRRVGLHDGAASCYRIVRNWAARPEHRIEADLELAVVAAEAGDGNGYHDRRRIVLESLGPADRPLRALIALGLGRAAALLDDYDTARDHLTEAASTARELADADVLGRSEKLLQALEQRRKPPLDHSPPSDGARHIAARVAAMGADAAALSHPA